MIIESNDRFSVIEARRKRLKMSVKIELVTEEDYQEIYQFEMRNKKFFETILPPRPAGYQRYDTFLVIMNNLLEEQSNGDYYMYIIRGENGEFIGRINLQMVISGNLKTAEIGYRMDFNKQGKGHAGHAVKLVLQEAFQKYGVSKVTAGTSIDNIGSQKVLEKNGFIKIGEEKKVLKINNEWVDGILYKKVHSDMASG